MGLKHDIQDFIKSCKENDLVLKAEELLKTLNQGLEKIKTLQKTEKKLRLVSSLEALGETLTQLRIENDWRKLEKETKSMNIKFISREFNKLDLADLPSIPTAEEKLEARYKKVFGKSPTPFPKNASIEDKLEIISSYYKNKI